GVDQSEPVLGLARLATRNDHLGDEIGAAMTYMCLLNIRSDGSSRSDELLGKCPCAAPLFVELHAGLHHCTGELECPIRQVVSTLTGFPAGLLRCPPVFHFSILHFVYHPPSLLAAI